VGEGKAMVDEVGRRSWVGGGLKLGETCALVSRGGLKFGERGGNINLQAKFTS